MGNLARLESAYFNLVQYMTSNCYHKRFKRKALGGRFDPWSPQKNRGREAAGPKTAFQTEEVSKSLSK